MLISNLIALVLLAMFNVLKTTKEISSARKILAARGLDCLQTRSHRLIARLGLCREISVGEYLKSWDILKSIEFVEKFVQSCRSILDIGAYASELTPILYRLKFSNLYGIDLNHELSKMPHASNINFVIGDYYHSPFNDGIFNAITAISTIEHGYNQKKILSEVSRLLSVGGFFVASFDYWPEKIQTNGITPFGLSWNIFSREEVHSFIKDASLYGLFPFGELCFESSNRLIHWESKDYTFGWIVLQKKQ